MSNDEDKLTDELLLALAQEKRVRSEAVAEAERRRRFAHWFQRMTAALTRIGSTDDALRGVIAVVAEAAGAGVAVLRVCEGTHLRSRVALGLEEEVAAGFTIAIDDSFVAFAAETSHGRISPIPAKTSAWSECMQTRGVRDLHGMPLFDRGARVGVLYLGMFANVGVSDEDRSLFASLATLAAGAIVRCLAYEALEQAVRSRDQVLAVVAHDLRNPLNVIAIAANTLLPKFPDGAPAHRLLQRIARGVRRADGIVQDLLEIDAIEGGRFSIDVRAMETADLILAAVESQHGLAAAASIIVSTDLSPELPPVTVDEERFLEVVENLIGNAVKFTPKGGAISVGANREEGDILFWVKDNGAGIPAEQLPHIFDRFWQAKREDRRGTGLGLTICKAIVDAHGGRIWVESTEGAGTAVFFTLPAAPKRIPRTEVPSVANVLLVDDRPENLLSLRAILDRPEYRLVSATSGREAMRLALQERFALALIDVEMPGMNGLEVAAHLKELERSRDIPIIFITAFGDDPEQIHRAYSAGGVDYLVKPLDAEIVRKKVAVFVGLSRRRERNARLRKDGTADA